MKKTYLLGIFLMLVTHTIYSFDTINSSAESNFDEFNTIYFTETGVSGSNIKSFEIDETDKYKMTVVFIDETEYLIQLSNDKEFDVQGRFDKTTRLYISKLTGTSCDRKKWSNYKITLSDVEENDIVKHRYHFYNTECNRGSRNIGSKESREVISKTGNPKWLYDSGPLYFYGYNNSTSNVKPFNISSIELERIGNINIPDTNFKNALLNHNPVIDTNGDGEIQFSEAENYTMPLILSGSISDLTGIEAFVNLTHLTCDNLLLTGVNLENNTELEHLVITNSFLTSLDVSKNLKLDNLEINNNLLTQIDVSKNTQLKTFYCFENQLSSIDVTNNTLLELFHVNSNKISSLDLSNNPNLTRVWCFNNDIEVLDLNNNTLLNTLHASNNDLNTLDVSANINLRELRFDDNNLTEIDLSKNTFLTDLYCDDNQLSSIDLSNNLYLKKVTLKNNLLTSISLEQNTALENLDCSNNSLESLDISKNNNLNDFNAYNNNSLSCIKVSDLDNVKPWWGKDESAIWSETCNTSPIANNDTLILYQNETETLDVLANDTDEDGDTLTLVSASATHGAVSVVNDEISYTANAEGIEEDTVTYEVSDGKETVTGTVTVVYLKEQENVGNDYTRAMNNYGGFFNAPCYPFVGGFVAIKQDGTSVSWGKEGRRFNFSDSKSLFTSRTGIKYLTNDSNVGEISNVKSVYSAQYGSYAFLKNNGDVVTEGVYDGVPSQISNVKTIFTNSSSFAALKNDGTVIAWAYPERGGNIDNVKEDLVDVKKIFSTAFAFAALKKDGTVIVWGKDEAGNIDGEIQSKLVDVKTIFCTSGAFAALKINGTVVAWGDSNLGGNTNDLNLTNIKTIHSNPSAFAALKKDGTVITWGASSRGGDSSSVSSNLTGITEIFSNDHAFSAINSNGDVFAWGYDSQGGDVGISNLSDVKEIFSTRTAFVALKNNGDIFSWGQSSYGGGVSIENSSFSSKIHTIYSDGITFIARHFDGSLSSWQDNFYGGNFNYHDPTTSSKLTNVVSVNMGVDYGLTSTTTDYVYNGTWSPSSPIGVSTNNDKITIQSGAVSFDQDVTADTVTVNPDASLSTATGTTLTANTITLESSQNSLANFLNEGTVNATVTYKRYVADEVSLDLIASPVSGQTFSDFASNNSNLFYQVGNASRKLFGHYDNTNRKYITYYDNDTRTIDLGTGYRAARLSTAEGNTLNFTGSVSNAQIDVPINTNGDAWNLIGNPYPTSISLLAFLTDNNTKTHDEYSGVYGYNGMSADKWDVWNLSYWLSNQSAVIAPAQGFFVKSKNASDNIVFKPSMRTTTAASNFNVNKSTTTDNGWFTIELTDGTTTVSTKVYLIEGTTTGLDVGYDAATFKVPNNDLAIYTSLADGSSNNTFAVQSVGLDNLNTLSIPVGLNSSQGKQIQVRIADVQLPEGVEVYFNDATKVSSTLLNKGDYTHTTLADLEGTGRFSITFSSDALSNGNQTLEGLQVYSQDQQIALQGYLEANTHITLYDLQGRAVSVKATQKASQFNSVDASHLPNGVYVLEVQNTKGRFTQKLILN